MSVLEILTTGRNILLDGGWCKDKLTDNEGRHCAVGALCRAMLPEWTMNPNYTLRSNPDMQAATALLARHIPPDHRPRWGDDWSAVAAYNNTRNDFMDILAMFDAAIVDAENGVVPELSAKDSPDWLGNILESFTGPSTRALWLA